MAVTLTDQSHLFPSSGETGFLEGDPLSTRFAKDMRRMLNNCLYTGQFVTYLQGTVVNGEPAGATLHGVKNTIDVQSVTSSTELYVGQCPILLAPGAKRLLWTVGARVNATSGTGTLSAITIYLTRQPYNANSPLVFDPTNLAPGYVSRSLAITGLSGVAAGYKFAADDTTGLVPPTPDTPVRMDPERDIIAHLVVTATGLRTGSAVACYFGVADLTLWPIYE